MDLASKKIQGFLYIDTSGLLYIDCTTGTSLQYTYPAETVHDLEIGNQDMLSGDLLSFLQTNNVVPAHTAVFLSPQMLFRKMIPASPEVVDINGQIDRFVDSVPFESVSFVKQTNASGTQVLAANENFFSVIKQTFEKYGSVITQVFPIEVFQEDVSNGLHMDSALRIISKLDSMKEYNLLQQKEVILPVEKKTSAVTPKKPTNHLYILLGTFGVLLVILVVMILLQR